MPATIIALADAVVASINGGSFGVPVTAVRLYQPKFGLPEMTELHVSVVPRSIGSKALDRNRDSFDYKIDVAVQKKTDTSQPVLDGLMELVEQLADHFRSQHLEAFPSTRCIDVVNEPVYAPEHLEQFRQFTSVLTLTFRVWR